MAIRCHTAGPTRSWARRYVTLYFCSSELDGRALGTVLEECWVGSESALAAAVEAERELAPEFGLTRRPNARLVSRGGASGRGLAKCRSFVRAAPRPRFNWESPPPGAKRSSGDSDLPRRGARGLAGAALESLGRGDEEALHFARLELGEATGVGAALVEGDAAGEVCREGVEGAGGEGDPWVEAVGDVEVPGAAGVAHERRGAPCHVGGEDGRGLAQADGPPRPAVARDEALVGAGLARDAQEALDGRTLRAREAVEVFGEVDHAAERGEIEQRGARGEELASARDGRVEHRGRQRGRVRSGDPNGVGARDLAAMDA